MIVVMSRWFVGSSNSRSFESSTKTWAKATFFIIPPESSDILRFMSVMPSVVNIEEI